MASAGNTVEEALKNLKEAIELYLENAKELGMLEEIDEIWTTKRFTSLLEVAIAWSYLLSHLRT